MSPTIIAALAALAAALPVLLTVIVVLAPLARRFIDANVAAKDADALKHIVKGAHAIVSEIARATPTTLDDGLAQVLELVSKELQLARGRPITATEKERVRMIALSLHASAKVPGKIGKDDPGALREAVVHTVSKRVP